MKIKRLQIRNIASIEKADIDFENGLIDKVTGKPASIFLISGDTGSGKSIILDAISMALYKTTPRVANVPSKSNNSYKSTNGQDVNIFSIQQYTRIGISPKDDCFCELLFEGNDGKDYTARVTLGLKNCQAKDSDGSEIWAHRNPAWHLQQGGNVWNKDSDIKPEIAKAVGLTFEQFNRMAMLAQGQFEKFLCGEKKEREEVLEQLTNTEHFTKFGEAIRSIFGKARKEKDNAEIRLSAVTNLIGTNNVAEWQRTIKENTQKQVDLGKQIDRIDDTLKQMAVIHQNHNDRADAQAELTRLQGITDSSDYKQKLELTQRWNETEEQRQARKRLLDEMNRLPKLKVQEGTLRNSFEQLVADLKWRKERNIQLGELLQEIEARIKQQESRKELYDNAQSIESHLGYYEKFATGIANIRKSIKDDTKAKDLAEQDLDKAKAARSHAQKSVDNKQLEINKLQTKRQELGVEELQGEITTINERIQQWKLLDTDFAAMISLQGEMDELKGELNTLNTDYTNWKAEALKRKKIFDEAEQKCNETLNRYTTMSSSLEDTLNNLRNELHHLENCPLCGQKLDHAHFEKEFFSELLTPLQKEKNAARAALKEVREQLDEAKSKEAGLHASIEQKSRQIDKLKATHKELNESVMQRAEEYELDANTDLHSQIVQKQLEANTSLKELQDKQNAAESLQTDINSLQRELSVLNSALAEAIKTEENANGNYRAYDSRLTILEESLKENTEEIRKQRDILSKALTPFYPQWETQVSATHEELHAAAEKFQHDIWTYDKEGQQHKRIEELCSNIENVRQSILAQFSEWECSPMPQQSIHSDIQHAWNDLLQQVTTLATTFSSTQENILKHNTLLAEYYIRSHSNEQQLDALIAQAADVVGAKNEIDKVKANITAQNQQIENANEHIQNSLATLKLKSESELPEKVQLEEEKKQLNEQKNACLQAISEANTLWNKYKENQKELAEAQDALDKSMEKFNRWGALDSHFGGTRFRTLVQTYILRPLLNNANIYLERITDRYTLTCSEDNEQLSILVLDKYNKDEVRSVTVLSGGERFMISLALSLALSSLNRPDLNINILFIDEGFGTLDEKNLDSVMQTLETLQQIAGQHDRRVGMISHREEIMERIPTQIRVTPKGAGRSVVTVL